LKNCAEFIFGTLPLCNITFLYDILFFIYFNASVNFGPGSVAIESNTRIVVLIDLSASTNVILRFCKYYDKSPNLSKASDMAFKLLTNSILVIILNNPQYLLLSLESLVESIEAKLKCSHKAKKLFMTSLTVRLLDATHRTDKILPIFKICSSNELAAFFLTRFGF